MKRLFLLPAFVATLFIASCEKDPDMDKLDNDYLVYTNYDEGTDFGKFNTYYVIDSNAVNNSINPVPKVAEI